MKHRIIRIVGLGVVMLVFGACQQSSLSQFTATQDILQELSLSMQDATQSISLRADQKLKQHEWYSPSKTVRQKSVTFYRYNTLQDAEINLVCRQTPQSEASPQSVEIVLNQHLVGSFVVEPAKTPTIPVTLPAAALRSGPNLLLFRFAVPIPVNGFGNLEQIIFTNQDRIAYLPEETQTIDLRKDAKPERYLLTGWSEVEQEHTWANARSSSLLFYRDKPAQDLLLEVICWTLPAQASTPQTTEVLLNGVSVGVFVVTPDAFHSYTLSLPAEHLRAGRNVLQFRFAYVVSPHEVNKDNRTLSVAFQKVQLTGESILKKKPATAGLVQHAASAFQIPYKLPKQFVLDLRYQLLNGARAAVRLLNDQGEIIRLPLSSWSKQTQKLIELPDEGVYTLQLVADGKERSAVCWQQIQIKSEPTLSSAQAQSSTGFVKAARPDMLLYVVDTLRADHLGCYGYQRNTSPNIDRFAKENVLFRFAYANSSWTKASGANIITGLLPKHHRTMLRDERLPDELMTLAEVLHDNGYYTAGFSTNRHIGATFGFQQGFDTFIEQPVDRASVVNTWIQAFLKEYLAKPDHQSLFMLVWVVDPHSSYNPCEWAKTLFDIQQYEPIDTDSQKLVDDIQQEKIQPTPSQIEFIKARYDQEIYCTDAAFGKLLNRLMAFNLYENSLIVFTGDHGEEFFEHGAVGHGRTLYNDQIAIPLIMKMPGLTQGVHEERAQHLDIYPTLLDAADITEPYALDGISLLRNPDPQRMLYCEENSEGNELYAILDAEKKVIHNKTYYRRSQTMLPPVEVYQTADILEQHNLAMYGLADEWRLQTLFALMNGKSRFDLHSAKAEISLALDQHLRDLGYLK